MKLEFTDQQAQYIVNVLASQPFKDVAEIMQSIQHQVQQAQQQAQHEGAKNAAAVTPIKRGE